jgi:hypothetical protein
MTPDGFEDWAIGELDLDEDDIEAMKFAAVFDLFISRIEAARARGAADPLQTVTAKIAGGNSRASTKRMLEQLGFSPSQRRAVHRLLAGSPSGWPGLLRLYVDSRVMTREQRQYARRQVKVMRRQPARSRSGSSAACSARAVTP